VPWDNSLNPGKGRDFQAVAAKLLTAKLGVSFHLDYPLAIGHPPKLHKFDFVSEDLRYVGECKNYSWTETGNVPSAKTAFLNEAVLYLSHVPADKIKFLVMRLDRHDRKKETLVEYYLRTYKHLLGGLTLYEIDPAAGELIEHTI
jgi:hypothetical protein